MDKVYKNGLYAIGAVRSNWKQIAQMKQHEQMKHGDIDFQYSNTALCCKWYDNKPVLL